MKRLSHAVGLVAGGAIAVALTVIGFTAVEVWCALSTLRAALEAGTELDVDL